MTDGVETGPQTSTLQDRLDERRQEPDEDVDDEQLPDVPREELPHAGARLPAVDSIEAAADGLEELNRLLKQLLRSVWLIAGILLAFVLLFLAYMLVDFVAGLL